MKLKNIFFWLILSVALSPVRAHSISKPKTGQPGDQNISISGVAIFQIRMSMPAIGAAPIYPQNLTGQPLKLVLPAVRSLSFISHQDIIMRGGTLKLIMGKTPNYSFGTALQNRS